MDWWGTFDGYVLIPLSVLGTVALIVVGGRRHALGWAFLGALSAWALVWLVGDRLRATEWGSRTLAGFTECWATRCTVWDALGAWLFFGPPIAGLVAIVTTAVLLVADLVRSIRRSG